MFENNFRRPHLIGVGGIGVSGIARALRARGLAVQGSDVRESSLTRALRDEGVKVMIGQREENIADADLVIYSTAIPESNPERRIAASRGIPLIHRSEVLGALMRERDSIGVLGTHGKGTTAALITWLLEQGGRSPSFIIGGLLQNYGTNTRWREQGPVVVEIDESDGSLVNVPTDVALINNLEADHLNYYRSGLEDVLDTFAGHLARHPETVLFGNGDDHGTAELFARVAGKINGAPVTFGLDRDDLDYQAREITTDGLATRFSIHCAGEFVATARLGIPGEYNVANAIGAVAVAHRRGVPWDAIVKGLASFRGLENRFTVVERDSMRIIKDYISHPTGIRRVLEAAKAASDRPIVAVFKPYRFTMVNYLQDDYATAFKDAAHTVITELYPAGEVPIPGIDTEYLCDRIRGAGSRVSYVPSMEGIVPFLEERFPREHQVIFFGGDDLFAVADSYAARVGFGERAP